MAEYFVDESQLEYALFDARAEVREEQDNEEVRMYCDGKLIARLPLMPLSVMSELV